MARGVKKSCKNTIDDRLVFPFFFPFHLFYESSFETVVAIRY